MTPACNIPEGFTAGAAVSAEPEVASLTNGLRNLLEMPDSERLEMGRKGRQLVEERYQWPQIASAFCSVYSWLIGRRDRPDSVCVE